MDEVRVEVIDGPFAGFGAVLSSHEGDRVLVQVSLFGRRVPVELRLSQVCIAGTASGPRVVNDPHTALRDRPRRCRCWPDRFVHSAGRANYDDYVLDLDVLDAAGNPTVATWAFKEWVVSDHKQFWDWLDSTAIGLIFGP
ncbi:hypothetical protein OHR68_36340 [Spirillospora sp. NBC_00431]